MAASESPLAPLLLGATDIGTLSEIGFGSAKVVTTAAEDGVGGVLRGSWLIAVADGEKATPRGVLLLRVVSAEHPRSDALVEVERDAFMTYQATVVGEYCPDGAHVEFATEVARVLPPARYRVMSLSPDGLSWVASYSTSRDADRMRIRFGSVRPSSAVRPGVNAPIADVNVDVEDFIGRRTAVFGITRSGKSSTIKTLVSTIRKHSAMKGERLGTVIFDPQGEYAAINHQDGTAIRLVGDEESVRIYRADISGDDPIERRLLLNFYNPTLFDIAWDYIVSAMVGSEDDVVRAFVALPMKEPDPATQPVAWQNWSRGRLAFYALLYKCGYGGGFPEKTYLWFSMAPGAAKTYNIKQQQTGNTHLMVQQAPNNEHLYFVTSPEQCESVMDWIGERILEVREIEGKADKNPLAIERLADILGTGQSAWHNSGLFFEPIMTFAKEMRARGLTEVIDMRPLHDGLAQEDATGLVWDDMREGRLVIVDLSIGHERAVRDMSERIVNRLIAESNALFRAGHEPIRYQVVVEEAHNLFERGRIAHKSPWVRIAKEGAKYGIGLMYATQEVTSVDQRILSSSHNWVIGHLNSHIETDELANYYTFAAYADSIRGAEEVGFMRVKTWSSPYVVPVQVVKFDHTFINDVRQASGLPPVEPPVEPLK